MRKAAVILVLLLSLVSVSLFSQTKVISGYVSDKETGEKIPGVVILEKNTNNYTVSNEYGYFSLVLKNPGQNTVLEARSLSYYPQTITINAFENKNVNFELTPKNKIDTVIVHSTPPITKTTEIGAINLPVKQIKLLPSLGAEPDIFKVIQLMPGVQSGKEGSSSLYVRGGNPDENLILLDDVPLYYVNHLAGFISIFNTDALKSVKLIKGGFPARYGSRLSSVIDVRMRDGDMKNYHKEYSIGITNAKFLYEGPIIRDKASFLVSIRLLPWEFILRPFVLLANEGNVLGYNFYDVNVKLNYKLNSKNHLFLSFYTGDDNLHFKLSKLFYHDQNLRYNLAWGNRLFAFRWNHIFSNKLFVNTTFAYTRFRYNSLLKAENKAEAHSFFYNFNTGIKDLLLKSTFYYNLSPFYEMKFGYNVVFHNFNPGITYYRITENDTVKSDDKSAIDSRFAPENILFIENNFKIREFFMANIGVRIANYTIDKKNYPSIEPRIVTNFILSKNYSIKFAYSEAKQYSHLLSSNSIGLTPDIWIPSDSTILPSDAKQFSAGFFTEQKDGNIVFSVVAYYKTTNNLISYKEGAVFIGNAENWKSKIETGGHGLSYGIEFLLQKRQGKFNGWISYTYAKAQRQFANINNGLPFPFKYDRRHDFSIVVNYILNKNISFSADWVYGSGYPFTMPVARYNIIDDADNEYIEETGQFGFIYDRTIYVYSDRNAFRMRPYHRLDIAVNFTKQKKNYKRIITISVYNVYNRQNPYFYYTKYNPVDKKFHLYQQSLFPIIPSVSYSIKF